MKEATGELNMTVITVVAVAAIGFLFYSFVWPMIQGRIVQTTCDAMGADYKATKSPDGGTCANDCFSAQEDDAGASTWCCCPNDEE